MLNSFFTPPVKELIDAYGDPTKVESQGRDLTWELGDILLETHIAVNLIKGALLGTKVAWRSTQRKFLGLKKAYPLHREDGPAYLWYNSKGNLTEVKYYLESKEVTMSYMLERFPENKKKILLYI